MKFIRNYYFRYLATKSGKVYDLYKLSQVKIEFNASGRPFVRLRPSPWFKGIRKTDGKYYYYKLVSLHRIIAETYIKRLSPWWTHVNHKDCDYSNNKVSNLEWVSNKENLRHSYIMGRLNKGNPGYFRYYSITSDSGQFKDGRPAKNFIHRGNFYPRYGTHNKRVK